ncbi:thioredoxin-related transmembrane protein 4 [Piliocolobus tephrosceles]|uniref:Thioredoxin related transmembrane protein 4 n=1 Tax=Piliocolobus tephrosceles TaxID=591936 RepID=A0A8C9GE78_9PRIM|nr:thioredoxin-related transmembrane protein 4 [Piliocolobus tephrosceles]
MFPLREGHTRQPCPYWSLGSSGACSNLGNIGSSVYCQPGGQEERAAVAEVTDTPGNGKWRREGAWPRRASDDKRWRPPRRGEHRLSALPGVGGVAPASPASLKNPGGRARLRAWPLPFPTLPAEEPRSAPNMAGGRCGPQLTALLAAWVAAVAATAGPEQAALPAEQSQVQPMTASNWTLVMEGEWMLKFYAPWCPSCQQTDSEWETFAKNGEMLQISVGKVDVIQEPGLSGRFFVTTLPAFFHAKDGIFRRYRGPGIFEDLQNYILEKKWQSVEPLTGWKSPASLTMSGMAGLFSISGKIWHLHNYFTVTLGIPTWCSYVFFVIATLVFGLFMGLVLVVISECFYVPLPRHLSERSEQNGRSEEAHRAEQLQDAEEEKDDSNEEENKDSLVDDEEEKEDLGDEDEAEEEEEEEDNLAAGVDEERSEANDQGPPGEDSVTREEVEPEEAEEGISEKPCPADTEVVEDSLRQRKSQHADKGL